MPRGAAPAREAEEVERLRSTLPALPAVRSREPAELQPARDRFMNRTALDEDKEEQTADLPRFRRDRLGAAFVNLYAFLSQIIPYEVPTVDLAPTSNEPVVESSPRVRPRWTLSSEAPASGFGGQRRQVDGPPRRRRGAAEYYSPSPAARVTPPPDPASSGVADSSRGSARRSPPTSQARPSRVGT